jgi:hypothetical protein
LLGGDGCRNGLVLQAIRLDRAQPLDLGLGGRLELHQLLLRTLERAFGLVELGPLLGEAFLGLVVVVDRRGAGLGDDLGEHVGLELGAGLAQVGQDRDSVDPAPHEAVDGDRLDLLAQFVDLDLERGNFLREALTIELEQGLLRFGREKRLGGVVGAGAGGDDLGRRLLGGIVLGLSDDDLAHDHRDHGRGGQCCEPASDRPGHTGSMVAAIAFHRRGFGIWRGRDKQHGRDGRRIDTCAGARRHRVQARRHADPRRRLVPRPHA